MRHDENKDWPINVQEAVFKVEEILEGCWKDKPEGDRVRILLWGSQEFGVRVAEVDWQHRNGGACAMQNDVGAGDTTCFHAERLILALVSKEKPDGLLLPYGFPNDDAMIGQQVEAEISDYVWRLLYAALDEAAVKAYFDRNPAPDPVW